MEKKRAILLSACGKKTYKLMGNLSAPQKPGEKTYDDIVKLVTDHQNPKPSSIVQRCKFNSRSRQPNESVSQFVAELRQISEYCDYKATLDDVLRDRLVCVIKEDRIQRRLLAEPGLTFKKAMEVATAMEMAAKNAQDLQVQEPKPVHKLQSVMRSVIDAEDLIMHGHLAKKCWNRGKQNTKEKPKFKQSTQHGKGYSKQRPTKTHFVEEDDEDMEDTYTIYQLEGTIFKIEQLSQNQETKKDKELQDLLRKYPRVFKEGLARPVPYALKEKIQREPDRLEKVGNIEKVEFSEWAAPIVPIIKPDKSVRICGDYKVKINQVSKLDNYPIPKTDDLYATLSGGQAFSKLDLSQAYQQIVLDEESRKYVTINTHEGLYQYNRLAFGVSSAPGIFQRTIENLLQGIPSVVVRVDDILVTGSSKSEDLDNLETVLSKLQESGMRLNKDKCVFLAPEVVYLGHRIDQHGIYPNESKVKAITEAPAPKNVTELKSYFRNAKLLQRFLQDLSSKLAPLHELLQKQKEWKWDKPQQEAFELSKTLLKSSKVLVHYDPNKEIILSCDASPYGIGAVAQNGRWV
ncbi:unnamed protein product [Mytilus coruscus]|uniref:Reverse transcriptase domain-containing protein n=1 Tax=Mytilus coruscus TaxID=42192 RepID=A0A6J8BFB1_MYTCO|nr:unnamed protein product [Mytilus coruscus]